MTFSLIPQQATKFTSIIRWVGGKSFLTDTIVSKLWAYLKKDTVYIEPFLGSGAVFFSLRARGWNGYACLNDKIKPLMDVFQAVYADPAWIMRSLDEFTVEEKRRGQRATFDAVKISYNKQKEPNGYQQAARFLYLNKRCFNGLYRENKFGDFTTSWGGERTNAVYVKETLLQTREYLKNTVLTHGDYSKVTNAFSKNTVIYADPPYDNVNGVYKDDFNVKEQSRLRDNLTEARERGAIVLTSNADTPRIRDLYQGWEIQEIPVKYKIGGAYGREKGTELLITGT